MDFVEFTYAPSARTYAHALGLSQSAGEGPMLAVAPEPDKLPASRAEVEAIARLFGGPPVLLGPACTRTTVLERLRSASRFHFAGHGVVNWLEPLKSGLTMAKEELVTVADLLSMGHFNARLASLSACETGIIRTDVLDEVVALPSAFLQAGFAGVVASLWAVEDESTALLMHRFYQAWHVDKLSPAASLRAAQKWLRDTTNAEKLSEFAQYAPSVQQTDAPFQWLAPSNADALATILVASPPQTRSYAHPFFWAAFYLTGV